MDENRKKRLPESDTDRSAMAHQSADGPQRVHGRTTWRDRQFLGAPSLHGLVTPGDVGGAQPFDVPIFFCWKIPWLAPRQACAKAIRKYLLSRCC